MAGVRCRVWLAVLGLAVAVSHRASGQESQPKPLQLADRGDARVMFYYIPAPGAAIEDGRNVAVLKRHISVAFVDVRITDALEAIGRQAGLRFVYGATAYGLGALSGRVTLEADHITVEAAVTDVLGETGLDVQLSPNNLATLVRRTGLPVLGRQQATGQLAGRVLDAVTRAPITQATIAIVGTALGTGTRVDGTYRITGVMPGSYRVTARRVGYQPLTRDVTVSADQTTTVDFPLAAAPTHLDEVVTTVTGDARKYQVGNLIETVQADSVMKAAPVTDLGDLINARVPGVQVFEPGGVTGESPQINIRGQNSLTVSSQPLLVIDGARVEDSPATQFYGSLANQFTPLGGAGALGGRLNDLNPEEIESVEVVKGPSAATLYGTDAANGVILITTKRGVAGAPRWDFSAEGGTLTMNKNRFPYGYYAWGHTTDGSDTPVRCLLVLKAAGSCVIDSVTHFSPLRDPATTIVNTGSRQQYSGQVSGGAQRTRYFVSGVYEGEVAPVKMPAADKAILAAERGAVGLEPDNIWPNALTKASGRLNLTTALGSSADLTVSSGLLTLAGRIPDATVWALGEVTPGYRNATDGWAFGFRPADFFAQRNREDVTHVTGSANTTWHPTNWLVGRATVGADYSGNYLDQLVRSGEDRLYGDLGVRRNMRVNIALYTIDLGATATVTLLDAVSSKTSVGAQYNNRSELDNAALGFLLAPGSVSVAGAAFQSGSEANIGTIVSGGYFEQTFGLNDRLFVTGGLRVDGGSAFGQSFKTAIYPKASASWLVSQEPWMLRIPGVSSLRLRAAYGASGVQPGPTDALATINLAPVSVDGGTTTGGLLGTLGNPQLKPERQTEFEGGIDLEALAQRVQIGATYYHKQSTDALINLPLPNLLGVASGTQEINVGSVRNVGYEISVNVEVIRNRLIDWSVGANGSNNQNRLLTLAPSVRNLGVSSGPLSVSNFAVGYPLYSEFDRPILGYKDLSGDGIIEPSEVTVGPTPVFFGGHYPTAQITYQTTLGLWSERVQLHVQVDSRSGIALVDYLRASPAFSGYDRAQNDPTAPLADQAATQAILATGSYAGFVENGSFTRLREISVTYNAPPTLTRLLRGRSASLTVAGRNLALWTHYRGADPEINSSPQGAQGGISGAAFYDNGGAPMVQYWIARVRLGL